jgi:3,4-dihydroxy-2-butanone 4-phosphate synthase
MSQPSFNAFPSRLQAVLRALHQGRPILLFDDDDREDEADLIVAAERIDPGTMAMLIREGSGIVCLCLPDEALQRLQLPPMVSRNESRYGTAFTVSIEAREGVATGVSAADRVTTIQAAIADDAAPGDLVSPGHVFPLHATGRRRVGARRPHRRLGRPGAHGWPQAGRRVVRVDEPRRHDGARRAGRSFRADAWVAHAHDCRDRALAALAGTGDCALTVQPPRAQRLISGA